MIFTTLEERETLKEEIKSEILAEMGKPTKYSTWEIIRKEAESQLEGLDHKLKNAFWNALSSAIKNRLGLNHIIRLKEKDIDEARLIANQVLTAFKGA